MDESTKRKSDCCCCELENKKRRKKKKTEECGLLSLPDAVVLSCLAQLPRLDLAAFSVVSKTCRSLVASRELSRTRRLIGCTEASFYVCLRIFPEPNPSWFVLTPNNRRLSPIPSNPCQAPDSSSFLVADSGIYVIGGTINGSRRTSDVWFLDCLSHTWRSVPSMKMARASASASLVDGKIYVFGGLGDDDHHSSSTWAEVFDLKTQTWELLICDDDDDTDTPQTQIQIHQSVVIEGKNKIYAVDEENQSFTILPSGCTFSRNVGKLDNERGQRKDWCAIGELLFSCAKLRRILWCEPDELNWKIVKGLEELPCNVDMEVLPTRIRFRHPIIKLCTNSAGNIVVFWIARLEDPDCLEVWSAEISVERRLEGREVWGNIVWSGAVLKLDPLSDSYGFKLLFSASVYA